MPRFAPSLLLIAVVSVSAWGAAGDPQVKTEHPWYPGELAFSTWERLFKHQAELYKRATGKDPVSDEDKALAAWYWRNLNYAHGEDGAQDYFDQGFAKSDKNREYWTGLFAQGFGLCGTTHAQWTAEMQYLLGPCRGRVVGVPGHNSFEVYLTGGAYGEGKWVLLDHDVSTVIFDKEGQRLISIQEIAQELKTYADPAFKPDRQRGWIVAGLHPKDAYVYEQAKSAEYLAGYDAVPPMVHLRSGETLRRYVQPGLEDGATYVYWGRNYKMKDVPGPARDRSWVNQPDKMYQSKKGTGWNPGQVRFANAVFAYTPDFGGAYKEGVIEEDEAHVVFEWQSPYVVGCTPANDKPWGVYEPGGRNGLVLSGKGGIPVKVSTDGGKTWQDGGTLEGTLDLTDLAKGHFQYLLRLEKGAKDLAGAGLTIRTVCQCNTTVVPRLKDGANAIAFLASGRAYRAAGPNLDQAQAFVVDGAIGSPKVTLELKAPRGEKPVAVYGAGWQASGNPPNPDLKYQIEYSADGGSTWKSIAKDQQIVRRSYEPGDFWSQSFSFGHAELEGASGPIRVRFGNSGNKSYRKVEAYLVYEARNHGATEVTFAWKNGEAGEVKTASHAYAGKPGVEETGWTLDAGADVRTIWVEYKAK
ncbi:MAG: hypothetical protein M5U26_07045 [Planctomycetota bacterium]|nr:hypothetical protein [Planctomycetota bacterium]